MTRLVLLLAALLGNQVLFGDNEGATSEEADKLLGFDVEKVQPADPDDGKPVARIFYDYIYPEDIRADSAQLTKREGRLLSGRILGELMQRYMKQYDITATKEEIKQYNKAFGKIAKPTESKRRPPQGEDKGAAAKARIAEHFIKRWKLDRALYKQYGGTVIFQQGNPLEPVGAYRQFLEEMEEGEVFEVFGENNQKHFWHYFVRDDHPFQVPAERINFDKPWWLQKPPQE